MKPGRRARIPYDEDRTLVPQPKRWGKKLAHASYLVLAAMGLLARVVERSPLAITIVVWTAIGVGLAAGVAALVRMRWEGRDGILNWALMGLTLNLLLAALFVASYLVPPTVYR